jgi:hypothetical protein
MDDDSNAALGSSSKLLMTQVNSYNQLSEELSSLSQDNQLITVVHYSTDWTTLVFVSTGFEGAAGPGKV